MPGGRNVRDRYCAVWLARKEIVVAAAREKALVYLTEAFFPDLLARMVGRFG